MNHSSPRLFVSFILISITLACSSPKDNSLRSDDSTTRSEVRRIMDSLQNKVSPVTAPKNNQLSKNYSVLVTDHNPAVQNFHILLKGKKRDETYLKEVVTSVRTNECSGDCNVSLYDSPYILRLATKYPLTNKEYLRLADHYVALSTFDAPNYVSTYPYQDLRYKELGGKNWKKNPVQ